MFTADCVLGQGTAVFEDLGSYIRSLERQLNFTEGSISGGGGDASPSYKIFPGHGPIIEDGPAKIREYIKHRFERERQVLAVLSSANSNTGSDEDTGSAKTSTMATATSKGAAGKTAMDIVKVIYQAYPVNLHLPAQHQILLHLKKLEEDGKVKRGSGQLVEDIEDVVWELLPQTQASL